MARVAMTLTRRNFLKGAGALIVSRKKRKRRKKGYAEARFIAPSELRVLRVLRTIIRDNLRGSRKFSGDLENSNWGIDSRQGAKHAKFGGKR